MARKKNKGYVQLDCELMDSTAFKELSAHQIRVLLKFMQKRKWATIKKRGKKEIIFDNTGLVFTYGEAEILGIKTSSFHKAVKKLVELGFLDVEHYGGWVGRDCSRYAISDRWKYYGTNTFRENEKKRNIFPGHDVRTWQRKMTDKATRKCSCKLHESVGMKESL